jgi:hypothetical protein
MIHVVAVLLIIPLYGPALAPQVSSPAASPAPQDAPAEAGPDKATDAKKDEGDQKQEPRKSLSEDAPPWWAAGIGALGGLAYLVAAWAGFVGKDENSRDRVLKYFVASRPWMLVPAYVLTAGGIALVFQLPERGLVPVQAFILGCTWPAVVSNYLSGRQSGDGGEEAAKLNAAAKATHEQQLKLERLPATVPAVDPELQKKLDALASLVDRDAEAPPAGKEATGSPGGEEGGG